MTSRTSPLNLTLVLMAFSALAYLIGATFFSNVHVEPEQESAVFTSPADQVLRGSEGILRTDPEDYDEEFKELRRLQAEFLEVQAEFPESQERLDALTEELRLLVDEFQERLEDEALLGPDSNP